MHTHLHKVQYYETDKMGVVHHSNYIRWFEEARVDYMDKIDVSYFSLEELGYISPVLSVTSNYKTMAKFGDTVAVNTKLTDFNPAKFKFNYEIINPETKQVYCTGETIHCFLNTNGKIISLKKENPNLYQLFTSNIEQ